MNRTQNQLNTSSMAHRTVQRSATLNRKYVKRPTKTDQNAVEVKVQPKVSVQSRQYARRTTQPKTRKTGIIPTATPMKPAEPHPIQKNISARRNTPVNTQKPSAKELKDRAIKQAMLSVATMESTENMETTSPKSQQTSNTRKQHKSMQTSVGAKRFALAFACAAICVGVLTIFVNLNMPDISVRVAAMQTGIDAAYPSYIPRDYSLSNIVSEDGKLTMEFNGPEESAFILTEEKSSWDSATLLNNFVKSEWGDNYVTTHEQGITIYINNSNATWVNGGILYKITTLKGSLTKKQINSIVVSL